VEVEGPPWWEQCIVAAAAATVSSTLLYTGLRGLARLLVILLYCLGALCLPPLAAALLALARVLPQPLARAAAAAAASVASVAATSGARQRRGSGSGDVEDLKPGPGIPKSSSRGSRVGDGSSYGTGSGYGNGYDDGGYSGGYTGGSTSDYDSLPNLEEGDSSPCYI